ADRFGENFPDHVPDQFFRPFSRQFEDAVVHVDIAPIAVEDGESVADTGEGGFALLKQIADSALVPTRSCRRSQRGYQCDYSQRGWEDEQDRKSTRLNSSHVAISYAVFCLKKKSDSLSAGLVCESKTLPTTRSSSCTS